jgi:hypothetical protein
MSRVEHIEGQVKSLSQDELKAFRTTHRCASRGPTTFGPFGLVSITGRWALR